MARPSYGPQAQQQARHLLEALLTYATGELEDYDRLKIEFNWQLKNQLIVKTTVRHLELLVNQAVKGYKLTSEQIKEALKRYKDFLTILEDHRTKTQGSEDWHFTLKLWFDRHDKVANLQHFDAEWERRRLEKCRRVEATPAFQPEGEPTSKIAEIDRLVQLIREQVYDSIQARCGYMRVLDMSRPIGLEAIYTTVNIYESISGRQRRGLTDLLQQSNLKNCTALSQIQEARISGLTAMEQYSKLMIFGKPGAGKTTFLKWLAIQCNNGHLWAGLIPVCISVKAFADAKGQPELLDYIHKQWIDCSILLTQTEAILQKGRALILLDGLDEVRESDHDRVLQQIREFSTQFHKCLFVITCRIAAQEYTFEQFTEVEIADFDDQQMTNFVTQWFEFRNEPAKTAQFFHKLRNQQRIRDLATNPLLLTLLCLVFQDSADFPANRSELYREGLEVLLKTWDAKRNIERDGLYRKLSLQCKEALLSQIAFTTFERGEYFFKRQALEQYIADSLLTLPTLKDKLEPWEIDSEAVLKTIEAQHGLLVERARGVYSFSHLTFQEYFTAKKIASNFGTELQAALQSLTNHILDEEWYEVFLLTVGMLQSADSLLLMIKAQIDQLLSTDAKLQQFLTWLNERATFVISHGGRYKLAATKAYHSFLIFDHINIKANAIAITSALNCTSEIDNSAVDISNASDSERVISNVISSIGDNQRAIAFAIGISSFMDSALETAVDRTMAVVSAIDRAIVLTSGVELKCSLQDLQAQLPDPQGDVSLLKQWWKEHGYAWTNQLREVQMRDRNLVHDWHFNESQIALLDQYYRANSLLVECLNSDCTITPAVRDEIEATLLLSIQDIEQYKKTQMQKCES